MIKALFMLGRRQLTERPVRTAITICGIALGVSVSIAIQTANLDVLRSFEQTVLAVAGRATLQISGGDLGVDEDLIPVLRRHPAVGAVTPVIQQGGSMVAGLHRGEPLVIMGIDLLEAADVKGFRVSNGAGAEPPFESLLAQNAVFVGSRLASEWGLSVGADLDILVGTTVHRLVVQGVLEPQAGRPTAWDTMAVMDIAAAQASFGLVGRLDRIDLVTEPSYPVDAVAEALRAVLPPPVTVSRPARRNEQVERMVKAFQLNLATLSAVGLLVGLLLVYNTVAFAVVKRRREIGIVRALGMGRGSVCALFMGEAALMGLIGGLLGSGLGVGLARVVVSFLSRTVSDLYVPVAALEEGVAVPAGMLLQGGVVGVTVALVGALVPSLEASRTAPARALAPGEYEVVQELRAWPLAGIGCGGLVLAGVLALLGPIQGLPLFGYASAFCILLGLSCLSPALIVVVSRLVSMGSLSRVRKATRQGARWVHGIGAIGRVAMGQVARAPGCSAVTISALMVGIAIMVGVGTMILSFRRTVEVWINQTVMADLVVAPPSWLQGDESGMLAKRMPLVWAEALASVPGVAAVDPYRQLKVDIQGRPVALVSRDLRLHAARSRYLFVQGESGEILGQAVSGGGVIVSEVLARTLGVRSGERLALMTSSGAQHVPVMGVFYDYATDGGKIVMDRSLYRRFWQDDTATVFAVYAVSKAQVGEVRRQLAERMAEVVGPEGRLAVISNAELKAEILAIFDRTFRVTYALECIAVAIALLGIVNTLLTSVLERQGEMATLRAIGASAQQIGRLVLWEAAYLGLLGAVLGLVGGGLLSVLLIEVINKQSFGWTIQLTLPVGLAVEAVGLALAVALAAGYLPARWAAKQPVAEGLRYE
ncbi:MAG: FtsX-like permease family protein [Nitrospirae bacterium]|nr:MAG: FtsX-like permease family protein [Nitrospirota bacterium]